MDFTIRNAIAWNKTAIRRAEGRLRRASNQSARSAAAADIARYEKNIRELEGKAR